MELDGLLKEAENDLKSTKTDLTKAEVSQKLDLSNMMAGL
jgi:hypothetical protein